jgi:hypothetical protein
MAIILEEYTTEVQLSPERFLWAKGLSAYGILKKIFSVYGGKCLSRKAVHTWVEEFPQGCSKVADGARPGAEVAETSVERLLCYGFRRNSKAMGQVYQCWWKICREINVFPRFEYHMFYFLYPFGTYLLTLRHINTAVKLAAPVFYPNVTNINFLLVIFRNFISHIFKRCCFSKYSFLS